MNTTNTIISDAQRQQFHDEGYFILENVIPEPHLNLLRERVMFHIERLNAQMDALGVDKIDINHRDSRYFISALGEDPALGEFIFSDVMAEVCRATLGESAYLFFEQYVVKAAEKGSKFSWHQDSGYVGYPHRPYLTCWCALDDVTEENGTVYVLPYSRAGTREMIEHVQDPESNDLVGYFGPDPGEPVIVPAGSMACFASTVFHRSGFNRTPNMRRVFLAQYSAEPLLKADGSGPWAWAEPFLVNGERVRFGA
jgi:ectoine hydroxylase-related dioxygenase (phytanoyl-CoA dioxygenase family)